MSRLPKLGPAGGHGTASAHAATAARGAPGPSRESRTPEHRRGVAALVVLWVSILALGFAAQTTELFGSHGGTVPWLLLGAALWASCSPAFWGSGLSSARLIRTKRAATDARQGTAPKIPRSQLKGRSLVHPLTRTTDSQTLRAAPGGLRKALDHRSLDARVAYQERRGLRAGLSQEAVDRLPARPSRS